MVVVATGVTASFHLIVVTHVTVREPVPSCAIWMYTSESDRGLDSVILRLPVALALMMWPKDKSNVTEPVISPRDCTDKRFWSFALMCPAADTEEAGLVWLPAAALVDPVPRVLREPVPAAASTAIGSAPPGSCRALWSLRAVISSAPPGS